MSKGILYFVLLITLLSNTNTEVSNEISLDSNQALASGVFTESEFQIQNKTKDVTVKIGDTREEVERKLGNYVDYYAHTNVYEYRNNVSIHYKTGIVDGIMIYDTAMNPRKFKTPRGIGYGSTYQDVIHQYGRKAFMDSKKGKVTSITYAFEKNKQGQYNTITSFDHLVLEGGYENVKILSMAFDQKGRLSFMMIAEHEFAYHPEWNHIE
ncbi:hypothetical protein ABEW19_20700 [Paenibacillus illinoisensis]|uniref:hypothetical protein n=1 Tax=Paenibacillus illinoisensis TaxID=59845 RepID=UPI003D26CC21